VEVIRSYKYKLYNSKRNNVLIQDIELYSEVYNHCVALYNRYYKIYGSHISKYDLQKHLTKIKKRYKTRWNILGSQAIQDITDRLDKSYKLFFGNLKRGVKTSPPKFKSRKKYKSFTLKQAGYKINQKENEITINKKKYKYFNSRCFDGTVKTLTVKRNHKSELFIIFVVKQEIKPKAAFETGKMAGFDFGLGTFLVASDGKKFDSPQYLSESFKELQKKNKTFSKKKRGSHNRRKAKTKLLSLYEKIANQRNDWQWKLAINIVKSYDVICLETLSFKEMQKNEDKTKQQNAARAKKFLIYLQEAFMTNLNVKQKNMEKLLFS
jgi:putative transposase